MYIGSPAGITVSHPGSYASVKEVCEKYDNRMRPWYVSASTGTKNTVLLLKISKKESLDFAKEFINYHIDVANRNDEIMIADLNSKLKITTSRMTDLFVEYAKS